MKTHILWLRTTCCATLFFFALAGASGATVTWTGGSGDWANTNHWSTGALPGPNDDVVITTNGAAIVVSHSTGTDQVNSITSQGTLDITGGSLLVAGNLQMQANLLLEAGVLRAAAVTMANSARLTAKGGTLDGVALNGTLDAGNTYSQIILTITNGLTLNGTMYVGNPTNGNWANVRFMGSQTLGGSGTVLFGNQTAYYNMVSLGIAGTSLTIGPGIIIRGGGGTLGSGASTYWGGPAAVVVTNQGRVSADAGGTIALAAQPFLNQGQLQTPSGSLYAGVVDNTGQTNIADATTGSLNISGGTFRGGTVTTTNGASLVVQNVTLDGVTVNGQIDAGNTYSQITLAITNGLTLNGVMRVGNPTNGNWASINFTGNQALTGAGAVIFGNQGRYYNVMRLGIPGTSLSIGPGITIEGNNGTLGSGAPTYWGGPTNVSVSSQGNISADAAGGTIGLTALPFINHGQLQTPGGALDAGFVDNTGQTNIANAATGSLNVSGGTIRGGAVTTSGGAAMIVQNVTLDGVSVNGILDAGNTYSQIKLTITNGLTLNGTMDVGNPTNASWANVNFTGNQTLGGNGTVVFGNQSGYYNVLSVGVPGTSLTIGPGITIGGNNGTLGSGASTYWGGPANVSITNQGTISADAKGGTVALTAQPFINHGQLQTPAGAISAGFVDNTGQTISANATTKSLFISSGTIRGGAISTIGGASLIVQSVTLDGVTVNGIIDAGNPSTTTSGILLTITNGLTLNGSMAVGNPTNANYWANIRFMGTQSLSGTGSLVFGDQSAYYNVISVGLAGTTLTIGPGITIRGQNGTVGSGASTYWGGPSNVSIINEGTISADVAGGAIGLTAQPFINRGQIQSPAGSLNTGFLDNTGQTITANAATGPLNLSGGTIRGGTVATADGMVLIVHSGTLDGVTLSGVLDVGNTIANGAGLTVTNGLTLNGTMYLGNRTNSNWGGVDFVGSQTLGGNGAVIFGNQSAYYNVLFAGLDGTTLTIGPGITVRGQNGEVGSGAGTFWGGSTNITLVNQGLFLADTPGGTISVTGHILNNDGNVLAFQGATLNWNGDLAFNGNQTLSSEQGATVQAGGNLTGNTGNSQQYSPQGTLLFSGGAHSLQAMSSDVGAVPAGYVNNFAYGTISIQAGAQVRLIPPTNAVNPSACVYVNSLVVPSGTTLNLNGIRLYARLSAISGTVSGGAISPVPSSGGPITFSYPIVGKLAVSGESDQWTFFGRAGQLVTVVVETGTPDVLPPILSNFRVQLVSPTGTVLSAVTNSTSKPSISLSGVQLGVDGTYGIQILAAPVNPGATGNYSVGVWDATPINQQAVVNQPLVGELASPYGVEHWNFFGVAGQQIQFQLANASSAGLLFSLQGPGGWSGFSGIQGNSGLVTLPASGPYMLQAQASGLQYNLRYAFELVQTAQTNLTLGSTFTGQLGGSGQAQLFTLNVSADGPLRIVLNNNGQNNVTELYAKLGSPPTRASFDFKSATPGSAGQQVFIPEAVAGTYYILVYGSLVPSPGSYNISAVSAALFLTSVSPTRGGAGANTTLTLAGAGFSKDATVTVVSSNGAGFPSPLVSADSFTQLTATFPSNSVAPGLYSILVSQSGGGQAELTNAVQFTGGGQARLQTRLVPPGFAGRHQPATIYVEYSNTGDAAMPAPLLVVSGNLRPILALAAGLTPQQRQEGFWTASLPPGWANSVQFLANGNNPGILQPGESNTVAIAYAGLQQPWDFSQNTVNFTLNTLTVTNTSSIDWDSLKPTLKPLLLITDAWDVVWHVFTNRVGPVWGGYVQALDNNAAYLGRLGLNVADIRDLLSFELQQADAVNVVRYLDSSTDASLPVPGPDFELDRSFAENLGGRYHLGAFGRGWSHNWEYSLQIDPSGVVTVLGPAGSFRTFVPDTRGGYFTSPGDYGALSPNAANNGFILRESGGSITAFTAGGRLDYAEDPNGNRVTCGYSGNQLVTLTHSAGPQLVLAYNGSGRIASVTDSTGRQTSYSYDSSGEQLTSAVYPGGLAMAYTYTDANAAATNPVLAHALTATTFPDGSHRYIAYDNQGRIASRSGDGGGETLTFAYNAPGSVSVTDADNGTIEYAFDHQARLVRIRDAAANTLSFSYDANRQLTKLTDPSGHSSSAAFDAGGNLAQASDASGQSSELTYTGPNNSLASLIDPKGNVTKFANDAAGNLLSTTYADGSMENWAYDARGEPQFWTNRRGQKIQMVRNAAGQITGKTFPDGRNFAYAYDARGLLTNVVDSLLGSSSISYDARGQMTNIAYPDGNGFSFAYDAGGRRTSRTGLDGYVLRYGYDALGRLAALSNNGANPLVQYSYDAAGRRVAEFKGNGTFSTYTYDKVGRVLGITNSAPSGATISFFNYSYDERGNRVSMATGAGVAAYTYDALNQLTGVRYPGGRQVSYAYDSLGNRTAMTDNGTNTTYVANALNQYNQAGGVSFAYDADGNLAVRSDASGATTYAYDAESRLVSVSTPTNGVWQHVYDAFGTRAAIIHDGTTNRFVYDPIAFVDLVSEYGTDGSLTAHFDHGIGLVSRSDAAGSQAYYSYDAPGNTRELTGTNGLVLNAYDYGPFGESASVNETIPNRFQFSGRFGVTEEGNGLNFLRARFYSASEGRFISPNPLSSRGGGMNSMTYCDNNPVLLADPTGLDEEYDAEVYATINSALAANNGNYWNAWQTLSNQRAYHPHDLVLRDAEHYMWNAWTVAWGGNYGGVGRAVSIEWWTLQTYGYSYGKATANIVGYPFGYHTTTPPSSDEIVWGLRGAGAGLLATDAGNAPNPEVPAQSAGGATTGISASGDPNQLIGPSGYAAQNFVLDSGQYGYQIIFENETNATAPAQFVQVSDRLSTNLNWSTFGLTEIAFGNQFIQIPPNTQHFQTNTPMIFNGITFQLQIEAGIRLDTGEVFAHFFSIDPATGLPPSVDIGFLPPEDGTGRGVGHVSYLVQPNSNLPAGLVITNVALIQFDVNPVIATDQVDPHDPSKGIDPAKQAPITIDAATPNSSVAQLPAVASGPTFLVSWSGTDPAGPGIGSFNIFVSINDGPFSVWLAGTTNTSATFGGQYGRKYAFYSIAVDLAGLPQPTPGSAQATTTTPAPTLQAAVTGNQVVLSWPAAAPSFILETTANLAPSAVWTPLTSGVTLSGNSYTLTNTISGNAAFYRLRQP